MEYYSDNATELSEILCYRAVAAQAARCRSRLIPKWGPHLEPHRKQIDKRSRPNLLHPNNSQKAQLERDERIKDTGVRTGPRPRNLRILVYNHAWLKRVEHQSQTAITKIGTSPSTAKQSMDHSINNTN